MQLANIPKNMNEARWRVLNLVSGGNFVEVGVHKGTFSAQILEYCNPDKLYLVDPWTIFTDETYRVSWYGSRVEQSEMDQRFEDVKKRFSNEIRSGKIELVRRKSSEAADIFEDESLDFVYLDGDHTYEGVSQDTINFSKKIKKGGYLIGDDYKLGGWWKDGVVRAFHELLITGSFVIEFKLDRQLALRRVSR